MFLEKLKNLFTKRPKVDEVEYDSLIPIDFNQYDVKPLKDISQPKQVSNNKEVFKQESNFLIKTHQETILNVEYNSQRDNKLSHKSACNVTCLAMSMSLYYKREHDDLFINKFGMANFHPNIYDIVAKTGFHNLNLDDKLFASINSKEFQNYITYKYPSEIWIHNYFKKCAGNEVFISLVEIINYILGDSKYATLGKRLNLDLIVKEISLGYPVIICGKFTGGHFVTVVGYNLKKNVLIVHDPWGDWNTNYKNKNGKFVEYSISKLFSYNFLSTIPILVHFDKRVKV